MFPLQNFRFLTANSFRTSMSLVISSTKQTLINGTVGSSMKSHELLQRNIQEPNVMSTRGIRPVRNDLHEHRNTTRKKKNRAPSMWKWIHKHGLQARLANPTGRETLLRRFVEGKAYIATFDRIMFDPLPYVSKKNKKHFSKLPPPYKFANTRILEDHELPKRFRKKY